MRAVEFLRKCGKPFAAGKLLATVTKNFLNYIFTKEILDFVLLLNRQL
jgi:hypothetical protein